MVKNREINGTEEIGLVTPTPERYQAIGTMLTIDINSIF